jgi:hypothetical protein
MAQKRSAKKGVKKTVIKSPFKNAIMKGRGKY